MAATPTDERTSGVLAIWHDVVGTTDELIDLFEWYNRQHHVERYDVPGFVRARRYSALEGTPAIFSRYDTVDPGVLASDAYIERVDNPTPWTSKCMPHYRNMSRIACRLVERFGRGEGGKLATIRFDAREGAEDDLVRWVIDEALPAIVASPGVVGGQIIAADRAATDIPTTEKKLRGRDDGAAGLVVLANGIDAARVKSACAMLTAPDGLLAHGAALEPDFGLYELVFDLSGLD